MAPVKGEFVRVLVTGDRGHIGAVLVPMFISAGRDVVGFEMWGVVLGP
jgi:nucleoside-diphosphate-sugar epimerase